MFVKKKAHGFKKKRTGHMWLFKKAVKKRADGGLSHVWLLKKAHGYKNQRTGLILVFKKAGKKRLILKGRWKTEPRMVVKKKYMTARTRGLATYGCLKRLLKKRAVGGLSHVWLLKNNTWQEPQD